MLNEIKNCEICGNNNLKSVLNLGNHPMCDDLVKVGDARICKEYPIEILYCSNCVTAHQHFQIPKAELFPKDYHYRARHTSDVLLGMRELVETCAKECSGLDNKKILDIGCNDGSLLSIFREFGGSTFGIEPTNAALDARQSGHNVINEFFTKDLATKFVSENGKPDIITFTNVFAHIEDLSSVIAALKILLKEESFLVIENHYLGAVLDRFQFDTFYHEHPRTYSFTSFKFIAESLGLKIQSVEFPPRYNGNIRIIMSNAGRNKVNSWDDLLGKEQGFGEGLVRMSKLLEPWKESKKAEIEKEVKENGKLSAKAFPGRAAIPVKILGLDSHLVKAVYEKPLSGKIGHYIPGTRIPILSDDEFDLSTEKGPILNLAWHIKKEIHSYMKSRGFSGKIIDIISNND